MRLIDRTSRRTEVAANAVEFEQAMRSLMPQFTDVMATAVNLASLATKRSHDRRTPGRFHLFHGASGHPASPHFADQHALWTPVQMVPMLYDWSKITKASDQLVLKPST
jgi:acyl-homoserine lactone acylase PvdQ